MKKWIDSSFIQIFSVQHEFKDFTRIALWNMQQQEKLSEKLIDFNFLAGLKFREFRGSNFCCDVQSNNCVSKKKKIFNLCEDICCVRAQIGPPKI